jgi:tRNA-modifying protein YgfZ
MATEAPIEVDGQYRQLREEAGLVRRPALRTLAVSGADTAEFLQGQLTNDVEALAPDEGSYGALLDRKGHLQSDARVLSLGDDVFWLIAEDEGAERLARHLGTYKIGREVDLAPAELEALSIIGPAAAAATGIEGLAPEDAHREASVAGVDGIRAVATDLGIDLLVARDRAAELAAAFADAGAPEASAEAAEILRVEAGRPRLGREMTTETMPAEAGIVERAVSFTKGCYIGQETVARLHYKGRPNRHLRGLKLDRPAAAGDEVVLDDRELGRIGTAVLSPAHGPIALAILRREAEPGMRVAVGAEGAEAEVIEPPFG